MNNLILLAQEQQQVSMIPSLVMFAIIGLSFYFLIIRPQKKQQKEFKETMDSLKVGDTVVTRAGVKGKIIELNDKTFILETGNNNTQIEYLRQAISHIDNEGETTNNTSFSKEPVGNLDYGNDKRFIDKLNELKDENKEYDLLLEDVYEFMVVENETADISVQNKFRLDEKRASEISNQLEELGILSERDEFGKRNILIDPRD